MAFSARRRLALLAPKRPLWTHRKAVWAADFKTNRYARLSRARSLSALVTCARASSHLLADLNGNYQTFGNDTLARLDGVGAYIGGQATNLLSYTQDFSNAYWTKNNVTIASSAQPSPLAGANMQSATEAATNSSHGLQLNTSLSTSTRYVGSVCAKAGTKSKIVLGFFTNSGTKNFVAEFDLSTGVVSQSAVVGASGWTNTSASIAPLANGGYRCSIAGTSPTAIVGQSFQIGLTDGQSIVGATGVPSYSGSASNYVYMWQADLTTPIVCPPIAVPAGGPGVCNASDVRATDMSWLGAAGLGANGLSVLASLNFSHVGDGVARRVVNFSDGTNSNELRLGIDSSGLMRLSSIVGGVGQVSLPISVAPGVGRYKVAANFIQGAWYLVDSAGNNAGIGTGNAPAAISDMRVAQDATGGSALNDVLEQLQVCRPLTQAEAQAWLQMA